MPYTIWCWSSYSSTKVWIQDCRGTANRMAKFKWSQHAPDSPPEIPQRFCTYYLPKLPINPLKPSLGFTEAASAGNKTQSQPSQYGPAKLVPGYYGN